MSRRIYQPTKNAMQSGKANATFWLAEYDQVEAKMLDPLMGRTGSGDMNQQVRLKFETKDDAITYAERQGVEYCVDEPQPRKMILKSYAENFK